MKTLFIKELKSYSRKELLDLFETANTSPEDILMNLMLQGILKTNINFREELLISFNENSLPSLSGTSFYFDYVGVIYVGGFIIQVYPKYINSTVGIVDKFKKVMRVIEKYKSSEEHINFMNFSLESESTNLLELMLYLVYDYYEYGYYINQKDVRETNGKGHIDWNRTINGNLAFLQDRDLVYPEFITINNISTSDFFTKLHKSIITSISREFYKLGLLNIFDLTPIYDSDLMISEIGESKDLLAKLSSQIQIEYNTRKQNVLKAMYGYILKIADLSNSNFISYYGTFNFNLIWEDVCSNIFANNLNDRLNSIKINNRLSSNFDFNQRLIDIIEKPYWSYNNYYADKTLIPDIISIYEHQGKYYFAIYDAKYYTPVFKKNQKPQMQPGIESINKQYLYELAYKEFIKDHNFDRVFNCFVYPYDGDVSEGRGYVELELMNQLGISSVYNLMLSAEIAYDYYLLGKIIRIYDL